MLTLLNTKFKSSDCAFSNDGTPYVFTVNGYNAHPKVININNVSTDANKYGTIHALYYKTNKE